MDLGSFLHHLPLLSKIGYGTLFAWVFLEQVGVPIPALPFLVAAGALVSGGSLRFGPALGVAVAASLAADLIWYRLGQVKGSRVLNLICRISWKPDTCITTTTDLFSKHGDKTLLFAKFVPGLSTLAPPLAGLSGMTTPRFLAFNTAGCLIWAALPLGAGAALRHLPAPADLLGWARGHATGIGLAVLGGFLLWRLLWRYFYRRDLDRELRNAIPPQELKALLDANAPVFVIDTRPPRPGAARQPGIPGSVPMTLKETAARLHEVPRDRPVVAFCDCPHEEGSVAMVQRLRELGLPGARPLHGSIGGWRALGYPTA